MISAWGSCGGIGRVTVGNRPGHCAQGLPVADHRRPPSFRARSRNGAARPSPHLPHRLPAGARPAPCGGAWPTGAGDGATGGIGRTSVEAPRAVPTPGRTPVTRARIDGVRAERRPAWTGADADGRGRPRTRSEQQSVTTDPPTREEVVVP
ncbi:hypothetical protein GCM10027184_07800 [Saccharothrix stipae]